MSQQQDWRPTASLTALKQRAALYARIREFFAQRDVLEVDTPLLSQGTVTDVYLDAFETEYQFAADGKSHSLFLQTSPEFALKRLLASYQTSIYQLSKAFRHEGHGRWHNPEFTMLEWYRVGKDHHDLMDEITEFLQCILDVKDTQRMTYQQAFLEFLDIDPLHDSTQRIAEVFEQHHIELNSAYPVGHDDMLQLLFSYHIEPKIGQEYPCFIYEYPASQSALAKLNVQNPRIADRFELYYKGAELANGYNELQNAEEQQRRFAHDNRLRRTFRLDEKPVDNRLVSALEHGLPQCAGVAMGIDRILMLKHGYDHIEQVLAFPVERA